MVNQTQYKRALKDCLTILILLLDEFAFIFVALLVLWLLKIPITWPIIALLAVLLGIFALVMHRAVLPSLRRKKAMGRESMVGLEALVIEPLSPVGIVRVHGEYWNAKGPGAIIAAGEVVVVEDMAGLVLEVRRKEQC